MTHQGEGETLCFITGPQEARQALAAAMLATRPPPFPHRQPRRRDFDVGALTGTVTHSPGLAVEEVLEQTRDRVDLRVTCRWDAVVPTFFQALSKRCPTLDFVALGYFADDASRVAARYKAGVETAREATTLTTGAFTSERALLKAGMQHDDMPIPDFGA